ncbi:MAG: PD-(D/E)XK nuclease family protein [Candidatus Saccharicenans sp.]|uniref:PD-(D/E)XK nuclease family protein n=1 Tax=Candidatus Saccharicenans sp. TaxID=2819258 RepID=UPI00404942CE
MSLVLIRPGQDLPEILATRLLQSSQDLTEFQVVFPEKRPGHYLRKSLAQKLKKSFRPPVIQSFDEFVDSLYLEINPNQDRPADPIDAVSVLYQLHRSQPEPLGGKAFLSLDEFFPLGLKLYQDLEELKAGLVTRENFLMIDSLAGQNLPEKTRTRLQKVSFFFENFYHRLAEEKLSTRATRLITVLNEFRPEHLDRFEHIILAGFYLLTAGETRLVKKVLESEGASLYLLDGPGIEEMAQSLGLDPKEAEIIPENPGNNHQPEIYFYLSPDYHGQLFILNNLMAEKVKNQSLLNEKQVIVLPALESLIPLHQQTLSALPEEAYNISLGYPLTRTPLYNFFDCLFNLIQTADESNRVYAPYYLDFVLHPYTKNIYFPGPQPSAELTRILFHAIQESLNQKKGNLFWSLEEIVADRDWQKKLDEYSETARTSKAPEFIKHLQFIHQQTIEPFFQIESIGDFALKLINLLNFLVHHSTAPLHLFFQPYAEEFFARLENLKNSLMNREKFQHLNSYFNLFRKLISEARVSFPGTPVHGLQVLGFWETRCLQFDEVYLLDMNEEVIPGSSKVDSLLPQMVRSALKLPTYREREKRYRYYLHQLVSGARSVHVFFVENSEKEKSRFVEEMLWEKQKKEKQPEASGYIRSASYKIDLSTPTVKPIAKPPRTLEALAIMEISASHLDSYLKCPLQFYYAHVLQLSEREELADTLERADIGTLVHLILNEYFRPYLNQPLPREFDDDRLVRTVDQVFETRLAGAISGNFLLMKEQITLHLLEFLENYQQPVVRRLAAEGLPVVISQLEKKIQLNYKVKGHTFRLKGKLDRVEKRGSDLCLLDYKTSASEKYQEIKFHRLELENRASWPEAIGSLQLPFYQLLAASEFQTPAEDIYPALLILGRNSISIDIEFSPLAGKKGRSQTDSDQFVYPLGETSLTRETRKKNFLLAKEIIDRLLLEIIDPDKPFTPDGLETDRCDRCIFVDFCGR